MDISSIFLYTNGDIADRRKLITMGIFRTPTPQKFEYNPRFWDPRKEELEERLAELDKLRENDVESSKARISKGLRQGFRMDEKARSKYVRRSNFRLLMIIAALLILSLAFIYVYLPRIMESLYGGAL